MRPFAALIVAALLVPQGSRAQSTDVTPGGIATLPRTEPALTSLTRSNADSITLRLSDTKTLRLHDFDFNGEPVDTAKIHLRALAPGVFELSSVAYTSGFWRVQIADANSSIFGLGERSDTLDHAHTIVRNQVVSAAPGVSKGSSTTHPVPFFLSTAGYGLWLDASEATLDFNASDSANIILDSAATRLRLLLFIGDAQTPGRFPAILAQFMHLQPAVVLPAKPQAGTFVTTGDFSPKFAPGSGLPAEMTAALSAGMSGIPLWSPAAQTSTDSAVQGRLCQFAAFTFNPPSALFEPAACSHSQALSAAFAPYRNAATQAALSTGQPLMRALALDFQDDPHAREIKDEYFFGPDLLVAPMTDENTSRVVYLPAGDWLNLFTGEAFTGPATIVAPAPLATIPVYARKGAVLPKMPMEQAK